MATQTITVQRRLHEWFLAELVDLVSKKHGNPVPLTLEEIGQLSDSEIASWSDRLETLARTPPK